MLAPLLLAASLQTKIDTAAKQTLALTGVPGASIAIVQNGQIVALRAYGLARLTPPTPVTTAMPFAIGSISKQFTAALTLQLAEDKKLSLDDKTARFLPTLTRAGDTTIRQLLSHTAGYQDCWPEDYSPLALQRPTTPEAILANWGRRPLDFEPGSQWQYSNTGYTAAGLIAQIAGGAPMFAQLQARILTPLKMTSAADYNAHGIPPGGPLGYERYGFGPPRPAPLDRPGWSFGSGGLAMTPHDLALWDISLINRSLLKPASYDALEREIKLKNGKGTGYALGLDVGTANGHKYLEHTGEETGFVARNDVFPDDRAAVIVLTNQDASRAATIIAQQIEHIVFGIDPAAPDDPQAAQVIRMLKDLAQGHADTSQLNANAQSYFSPLVIADYKNSLTKLGPPLTASLVKSEPRGGMVFKSYDVSFPGQKIRVTTYVQKDGRLGQFLIQP